MKTWINRKVSYFMDGVPVWSFTLNNGTSFAIIKVPETLWTVESMHIGGATRNETVFIVGIGHSMREAFRNYREQMSKGAKWVQAKHP